MGGWGVVVLGGHLRHRGDQRLAQSAGELPPLGPEPRSILRASCRAGSYYPCLVKKSFIGFARVH